VGASCAHHAPAADALFRRVLWIALAVNAAMFVVEVAAGMLARSLSLQADSLDFLGDAANYGISLFVLGLGARARASAALGKGVAMGTFGLWVIGAAAYRSIHGAMPEAAIMAPVGLAALAANVTVAFLLFRYRRGDSNMRSVWLCSRNDAIGNLAVIAAAGGVYATGSLWPDLAVGALIAGLSLAAAYTVVRLAATELRAAGRAEGAPAPAA